MEVITKPVGDVWYASIVCNGYYMEEQGQTVHEANDKMHESLLKQGCDMNRVRWTTKQKTDLSRFKLPKIDNNPIG